MEKVASGETVLLQVTRDGGGFYIAFELK